MPLASPYEYNRDNGRIWGGFLKQAIAVIINDIHYNINTLEIADKVTRMAVDKANELDIPLIIAGDLHDTKANMRAECVNRMLETLELVRMEAHVIVGNHDKINEKSKDNSLDFLKSVARIVDEPQAFTIELEKSYGPIYYIPYHDNPEELRTYLKLIPKDRILIMHQGLNSSNSGHYIQDRSAINPEDVAGRRVISGHYHTRQDIKLPGDGLWTYTGNPYTLNFGEANDPEKGFHVLYQDGTLDFIPTKVRKHVIWDLTFQQMLTMDGVPMSDNSEDLAWIKVRGTREELTLVGQIPKAGCKLDLIPLDSETKAPQVQLNQSETLDVLIDSLTNTSDDQKQRLKQLWKDLK